jgi:acetyl-CoA carboxylase carboxyltransferase component
MGGPEKIEKRRAQGVLNARERIDYLLDKDSFVEMGLFAKAVREEVRHKSPADGKIAGLGHIDGRPVALVSNDFTVLGASSSAVNMKKMSHMRKISNERGIPLILLGESTGARMPDRMGAAGRATMGGNPIEYRRMREAPMVSALLGECYGSSTWYTCISDFKVMRKGAHMAVASGRVSSIAINQPIDAEELGGWKLHDTATGLVDIVSETDEEALDIIKKYLSYLPSNNQELPPEYPIPEGSDDAAKDVFKIIPEQSNKTYNMRDVLKALVDKDSLFELKPRLGGRSLITAFARMGGKTIGIIANNPQFLGGAIDTFAMRKATSFIVQCDSFNIPLVFFVDQPGFLIGVAGERRGAPGLIMNWLNALQLATVPKFTVVIRKDYGQAYLNMCGGHQSDAVLLWPTADFGFMSPAVGVNVLYNVKEKDDPERFKKLVAEIARDSSAWDLAALYEGHMVLDPKDTRSVLIQLLNIFKEKRSRGMGQHLLQNWPTSY